MLVAYARIHILIQKKSTYLIVTMAKRQRGGKNISFAKQLVELDNEEETMQKQPRLNQEDSEEEKQQLSPYSMNMDQPEENYPSTQQVESEVEVQKEIVMEMQKQDVPVTEKEIRRRIGKSNPKTTTSSKRCVSQTISSHRSIDEELLEEQQPDAAGVISYLGLIIMLWDDDTILLQIGSKLKSMQVAAMKERMFSVKKHTYMMQQGIIDTLKALKAAEIAYSPCSLKVFVKYLRKGDYYTTFTKRQLPVEEQEWIIAKYLEDSPVASVRSANTETITTLSTTAPTVTAAVAVPSYSLGKNVVSQGVDILDELYQSTTSPHSTGGISQSISRREGDTTSTLISPGEFGYRVVKLDVFDFNKICNLPKEQWWKQATYRCTFITSSIADPKEATLTKLLSQVATDLKQIPDLRKEVKEMKSFYGYRGGPQHQ